MSEPSLSVGSLRGRLLPAPWPRWDRSAARLVLVDPRSGAVLSHRLRDLPRLLRPGDLIVVNDAATLPASLRGRSRQGPVELRLLGPSAGEADRSPRWSAVLFGRGTWRQRTESRPAPPLLPAGERLAFGAGTPPALRAEIVSVSPLSPRLVEIVFDRDGDDLWPALFRLGRPVQYAHMAAPLALWHVQTPFASRPWAAEMPSAAWPLTLDLLGALRDRSIGLARLTHAAGLSSTGDLALDALLPLPERTDVPEETVAAVRQTQAAGNRVVAVGTTVVRALEGRVAEEGDLRPGPGLTRLRIGPGHEPRVVDGLLSGLHEPGESHFELLRAFAPARVLEAAVSRAQADGLRGHEFGDLCLILARTPPRRTL